LEKKEANLFDELYRNNIKNVISIDKKTLPMQPSNEDHKFLIKLVKPTYIIPVSGLQMNFLNYQKMAVQMNIPRQNILTLSNGEVVTFENAILNPKHKFIKLEQQFVNEQGFVDNAPISMFEREQMKENGVVLVSLLVDLEKKQILKYNYDMIGVTSLTEENKKIITPLNEEFNKQISNLIQVQLTNNKRINTKDLKNEIKKLIDKQYNKKFSKKPLILSTIIFSNKEVENESNDSN
jgi:ribonuclease J